MFWRPCALWVVAMCLEVTRCEQLKTILYFTEYFESRDWLFDHAGQYFGEGQVPFLTNNCPVNNCFITHNRSHLPGLSEFDALIFHAWDMPILKWNLPDEDSRKPNQVYVFFSIESPVHDGARMYSMKNMFNLSMTYRHDSDIQMPYGYIVPRRPPYPTPPYPPQTWIQPDFSNFTSKKGTTKPKKLVSWLVSKCRTVSQRMEFVSRLGKHIPVDQFGLCSGSYCDEACFNNVWTNYKFYLAFENSHCEDYITEKFWRALEEGVVPVVLGSGNYEKVAPPHSYIHTKDFRSPAELAAYLLMLDQNATEYAKYHWWRDHYTVHHHVQTNFAQAMCKLCEKIQSPDVSVYEDLDEWWKYNSCTVPAGIQDWFSLDLMISLYIYGTFFLSRNYDKIPYDKLYSLIGCLLVAAALKFFQHKRKKNIHKRKVN